MRGAEREGRREQTGRDRSGKEQQQRAEGCEFEVGIWEEACALALVGRGWWLVQILARSTPAGGGAALRRRLQVCAESIRAIF